MNLEIAPKLTFILNILTITVCSFALSCSNIKNTSSLSDEIEIQNWCPEDGVCTFEKMSDKKLSLKKDKFENSYTEIIEGDNTILKFEYNRKKESSSLEDDFYKEIIYVELNNLNNSFKSTDLKKYKVILERLCFCRSQTGSYLIDKGSIEFNSLKNKHTIKLSFETSKAPHIIKYIETSF